jgi:hypothetical protein
MNISNDTFIEEMVRRGNKGAAGLMKFGIVALALIIDAAMFIFYPPLFPVLTALLAVAAFLGFKYTITEYEYSYIKSGIDADLDFDKILGQRKRTQLISVKCKMIRNFAPAEGGEPNSGRVIDASIGSNSDRWYLTTSAGDGGEVTVYFNPSERLQAAIKQSMPRGAIR